MSRRKVVSLGMVLIVGALGIWLLGRPSSLTPESASRQQARLGALAPAGASGAEPAPAAPSEQTEGQLVEPVVVNLSDIPAGVYDPNNQFDRWQRGEIDLDENESIVGEAQAEALRAAALKLEPNASIQQAQSGPGLSAPVLGVNFPSIDINGCCGGGANVPPDPEMAAGPNHLIAAVNVSFQIYNKAGASLAGPITFSSFFGSQPVCTAAPYGAFDPNVLYDEKADRFMIGVDGNGRYYCAAVSQTGDPLGAWSVYAFSTSNPATEFYDYPHAGIGEDAIYVGSNIFNSAGTAFVEGRIHALDKAAMYAGGAATSKVQNLGSSHDTPQPMNTHGWNQGTWPTDKKHYILDETNYNGREHTLWRWDGPFTGPNTFASVAVVDLNAATGVVAGMPVSVPQSGGQPIQGNDWRPLDFEYRNGYGWTTMTIACNPGSGTVDCVRWAQINLTTGAIGPQGAGVFSSSREYRIFPDLAVNRCDDITIGYSKSSSSIFPSVWYTGREHGNPVGTLQAEAELKAGEIVYTAFDGAPRRWGDYTGMTIDPNGLTFWYLGEYSKITNNNNGRWGTYIGSFSYAECQGGGGDQTVHSGDLDALKSNAGQKWNARVTVLVHDNAHAPVSGATVTFSINNGALTRTCLTGATGTCYTQVKVSDNIQSLTFRVTNISKGGYTYNGSANHDPDTDSDGTTIIVTQP